MITYAIEIKNSALKEMDSLSDRAFERIDAKILQLITDPRPSGCKKLRGHKDIWRIRIGEYRVVYAISDAKRTISILRVAHRSEAYQ